jgi:serine/threonine-protein kinase
MASTDDLLEGTAYRTLGLLGCGAMGEVLDAEHTGLKRRVVVKVIRSVHQANPAYVDRLRLEAQSLAAIRSPNVVQVTDFGRTATGKPFIAMERLYGRTLKEELTARGYFPVDEAIRWMLELLSGLEAAHSVGIVHRDIKPANLFFADEGTKRTLKIVDFGVAKAAESADIEPLEIPTLQGMVVGTPRFVSPEQACGFGVDARSDLYSATIVFIVMVAGKDPFANMKTPVELLRAHALQAPMRLSQLTEQTLPKGLDELLLRAMAKEREGRFPSARAYMDALEALVAAPVTSSTPAMQKKKSQKNSPWLVTQRMIPQPEVPASTEPSTVKKPPVRPLSEPPTALGSITLPDEVRVSISETVQPTSGTLESHVPDDAPTLRTGPKKAPTLPAPRPKPVFEWPRPGELLALQEPRASRIPKRRSSVVSGIALFLLVAVSVASLVVFVGRRILNVDDRHPASVQERLP